MESHMKNPKKLEFSYKPNHNLENKTFSHLSAANPLFNDKERNPLLPLRQPKFYSHLEQVTLQLGLLMVSGA